MRAAIPALLALGGCWLGPWPEGAVDTRVGFAVSSEQGPWFRAVDEARLGLEDERPGLWTHLDSVDPGSGAAADLVDPGRAQVVILADPDLRSEAEALAGAHPEIPVLRWGTTPSVADVAFSARLYQAWYGAGVAAARASATGHIAAIAPAPSPRVVRWLDAWALGALHEDPALVVEVAWAGGEPTPTAESALVRDLVARGADVVATLTGTDAVPAVVDLLSTEQAPVWSVVGHHGGACGATCLTGATWRWEPLYDRLLAGLSAGTLAPGDLVWEAPRDGAVELLPLPEEVDVGTRAEVEERWADLVEAGAAHLPFEGPLRDTDGTSRLEEGEAATDADLAGICWLVEGLVDDLGEPAQVPAGCEEGT